MSMGNCLELLLVLSTKLEMDARPLVKATIDEYSINPVELDGLQLTAALEAAAIRPRPT